MEYVYSALVLHAAGKPVTEDSLKRVLTSAGVKVDDARVKAVTASLEGVDIAKAIESAVALPAAHAGPAPAAPEKKKEEKKEEEEKVSEEEGGLKARRPPSNPVRDYHKALAIVIACSAVLAAGLLRAYVEAPRPLTSAAILTATRRAVHTAVGEAIEIGGLNDAAGFGPNAN